MIEFFEIPGFVGQVNMTNAVIPNGSFTWGELLHWEDYEKENIRIPVDAQHSMNLVKLCQKIQSIRFRIGQPMTVISGYRLENLEPDVEEEEEVEKLHREGKAIDLYIEGLDTSHRQLANKIYEEYGFNGGVGGYDGWIHLDTGERRKWGF